MNDEESRLATFSGWPVEAAVDPARVARGGFFSTGRGQEVECFSCAGHISDWAFGDQVMARHRLLNPLCPFVLDPLGSGNVPAGRQAQGRPPDQLRDQTSAQSLNQPSEQSLNPTQDQHIEQSPSQSQEQPPSQSQEQPPGVQEQEEDLSKDAIYKADMLRLLSFSNWPVSFISPESLALAGFYYVGGGGGGDRVRCAWCHGELQNWLPEDRPLSEHLRHFPHCSYAKNRFSLSSPESNSALVDNEISEDLGIVAAGAGSGEAGLHSQEARLRSFPSTWPPTRPQQPSALAAAGFFYVSGDDQVRCFHCCGELCRWQKEDDPWIEHAKWFPHCGFLLLAKGQNFINAHKQVSEGLEEAVERCMRSAVATVALSCGLQPHTLKQAYRRRIRETGTPFQSTEALIDAALNEEINGTSFVVPNHLSATAAPPSLPARSITLPQGAPAEPEQEVSMEEENRRLKEARLCKVCMDAEVGVVFLPCGHLLSCVQCAPCLPACPLCRSKVKGIVRTYLS